MTIKITKCTDDAGSYDVNGVWVKAYGMNAENFTEEDAVNCYKRVWQEGKIPEPFELVKIESYRDSLTEKVDVDYFIETPMVGKGGFPKECYIMRLGKDEQIFYDNPERLRSAFLRKEKSIIETQFNNLPIETQWLVIDWISQRIRPVKNENAYNINDSSYRLKHILEKDTGIYLRESTFIEAMAFCGYLPCKIFKHGDYECGTFKISAKFEPYTSPDNISLEKCKLALDNIVSQLIKNITFAQSEYKAIKEKINSEKEKIRETANSQIADLREKLQSLKAQLKASQAKVASQTKVKVKQAKPKNTYVYKKAGQRKQHVYILEMSNGTIKIGIAANVKTRANNIRTGSGMNILQMCYTKEKTEDAHIIEEKLHKIFEDERTIGEYFTTKFELARETLEKELPIIDKHFNFE